MRGSSIQSRNHGTNVVSRLSLSSAKTCSIDEQAKIDKRNGARPGLLARCVIHIWLRELPALTKKEGRRYIAYPRLWTSLFVDQKLVLDGEVPPIVYPTASHLAA